MTLHEALTKFYCWRLEHFDDLEQANMLDALTLIEEAVVEILALRSLNVLNPNNLLPSETK